MVFVLWKDNIPPSRRPFRSSTHPLHQSIPQTSDATREILQELMNKGEGYPNREQDNKRFKSVIDLLSELFFHTPFLLNVDFISVTLVVDKETRVSKDVTTISVRKDEFISQVLLMSAYPACFPGSRLRRLFEELFSYFSL